MTIKTRYTREDAAIKIAKLYELSGNHGAQRIGFEEDGEIVEAYAGHDAAPDLIIKDKGVTLEDWNIELESPSQWTESDRQQVVEHLEWMLKGFHLPEQSLDIEFK